MSRFVNYYGQWQGMRGSFGGLPGWARTIVAIAALPGIILLLLSLLAVVVSLLALFLIAGPVYSLMRNLTGGGNLGEYRPVSPGTKRVEVTVIK